MALPPPPPGLDLSESRTTEINGTLIGMFSLATVTISLRMFSRRLKGNPIVGSCHRRLSYWRNEPVSGT